MMERETQIVEEDELFDSELDSENTYEKAYETDKDSKSKKSRGAKKKGAHAVFDIIDGRKILTEYGKKVAVALISFVLVLAIGLGSFFGMYYGSLGSKVDVNFRCSANNKEVGNVKSEILVKRNYAYGVFYPETEIEAVDSVLEDQTDKLIKDFVKQYRGYKPQADGEGAVLFCDYESNDYGKYVQVVRDGKYQIPQEEITEHIYTVFYDTEAKKVLKGSDVFDSTFKEFSASRIKKYLSENTGLEDSQINKMTDNASLDNFSISKANLYIYLNDEENNTHPVKFELDNSIKSHLKIDFDAVENAEEAMKKAELNEKYKDYIQNNDFGKPLTPGIDPKKPMVALTFDDGPDATNTKRVLDVLEEYNSVATFFVVGSMVDEAPEMVKRAHEMGCEIANHTDDHDFLTYASDEDEYDSYVNGLSDRVKKLTGVAPTLLRPPGGDVNDEVLSYAKHPLIHWSVDTGDWASRNTEKIVNVVKGIEESGEVDLDGEIILMHDIYDTTAEAAEILVPYLIEKGYQLVTVSDLLQCRRVNLEAGKIYYNDTNDIDKIGDYSYDVSGYNYSDAYEDYESDYEDSDYENSDEDTSSDASTDEDYGYGDYDSDYDSGYDDGDSGDYGGDYDYDYDYDYDDGSYSEGDYDY